MQSRYSFGLHFELDALKDGVIHDFLHIWLIQSSYRIYRIDRLFIHKGE